MNRRGKFEGTKSDILGDSAVASMSDAQARNTLLGAFDRASKADQSYLVKVAMMLGAVDVTSAVNDLRAGVQRPRPNHLRLVRPV
jgi:hypothetical protein